MWLNHKNSTLCHTILQLVEFLFGEISWHFGIEVRQPAAQTRLVVLCLLLQQLDDLGLLAQPLQREGEIFN